MSVRLDKWLQVARVFKTRSLATKACTAGRVRVDGSTAKAHRRVAIGNRVEIDHRHVTRILLVRQVRDKPVPKALAAGLFEDLTPPQEPPTSRERLLRRSPAARERGQGRPTKKQRREIDRLR